MGEREEEQGKSKQNEEYTDIQRKGCVKKREEKREIGIMYV